jgi:hypothetical protein
MADSPVGHDDDQSPFIEGDDHTFCKTCEGVRPELAAPPKPVGDSSASGQFRCERSGSRHDLALVVGLGGRRGAGNSPPLAPGGPRSRST